jgi:hypothetical protein
MCGISQINNTSPDLISPSLKNGITKKLSESLYGITRLLSPKFSKDSIGIIGIFVSAATKMARSDNEIPLNFSTGAFSTVAQK